MSPVRTPPGDGLQRCREAVEMVTATGAHRFGRDKAELLEILSSPHFQVSEQTLCFCFLYEVHTYVMYICLYIYFQCNLVLKQSR